MQISSVYNEKCALFELFSNETVHLSLINFAEEKLEGPISNNQWFTSFVGGKCVGEAEGVVGRIFGVEGEKCGVGGHFSGRTLPPTHLSVAILS